MNLHDDETSDAWNLAALLTLAFLILGTLFLFIHVIARP